jgi:hypothetical protein
MRAGTTKSGPIKALFLLVFTLATFPGRTMGQDITNSTNIGLPLNGIFDGSDFDNVQTANGNLHVQVPLFQVKGRGPTMSLDLNYDGLNYYMTERCLQYGCYGTWHRGGGGWSFTTSMSYGLSAHTVYISNCGPGGGAIYAYTGYILSEPDGTMHNMAPDWAKDVQSGGVVCFWPITNGIIYASDGSGFIARVDPNTGNPAYNGWGIDIVRKDGTEIKAVGTTVTLTDPNGN